MKNYKEFEKISIGESDIAKLIIADYKNLTYAHFEGDGSYEAYECFGDVEIGEHYEEIASGEYWLKIFDDHELCYYKHPQEYHFWDFYLCGYTAIIHWH